MSHIPDCEGIEHWAAEATSTVFHPNSPVHFADHAGTAIEAALRARIFRRGLRLEPQAPYVRGTNGYKLGESPMDGSVSAKIKRRVFRTFSDSLDRLGLSLMPTMTSTSKVNGFRIQWRKDEDSTVRLVLVNTVIDDKPVRFVVANEIDEIQREHRSGRFYEEEELEIIGRYFHGGTFVDIGANVGNHSLYVLLNLSPERIIAFEPVPMTFTILEMNIAANGLSARAALHNIGLSDKDGSVSFASPKYNVGATRLVEGESSGSVQTRRGDDVLREEKVDFIKIDTEGFEMKVLEGLRRTIQENRPPIFVELEEANVPAYESFCREMGYKTVETFKRYPAVTNYLSIFDRTLISVV